MPEKELKVPSVLRHQGTLMRAHEQLSEPMAAARMFKRDRCTGTRVTSAPAEGHASSDEHRSCRTSVSEFA